MYIFTQPFWRIGYYSLFIKKSFYLQKLIKAKNDTIWTNILQTQMKQFI